MAASHGYLVGLEVNNVGKLQNFSAQHKVKTEQVETVKMPDQVFVATKPEAPAKKPRQPRKAKAKAKTKTKAKKS